MNILAQIIFDTTKSDENIVVRSSAVGVALEDILTNYLYTQTGKGIDARAPMQRPVYHVTIGGDSFHEDDTGNAGIAANIVMDAFRLLRDNKLDVLPLLK